jgi:hypothetical protein
MPWYNVHWIHGNSQSAGNSTQFNVAVKGAVQGDVCLMQLMPLKSGCLSPAQAKQQVCCLGIHRSPLPSHQPLLEVG